MSVLEQLKKKVEDTLGESRTESTLKEISPAMREKVGKMAFGGMTAWCRACWGSCPPP